MLGATEVSLGRHENNSVAIDDVAASKHHCVIRPCGGRFQLHDLKSRNGTFVNGVPVTDWMLQEDDEIRVGESVFRFQLRGREDHETTTLHSGDSIYLNPQRLDETLPPSDRTARGVHVLLRISRALQVAQTVEALERQLLELAADAFAAFEENGVFDHATAHRFLDAILTRGGSRDALEAFIEFRGRKPDVRPLLKQHGILAPGELAA